jgi:hypothetical protein
VRIANSETTKCEYSGQDRIAVSTGRATLAAMLGAAAPAAAGETPKYGGSLIFMIPADAPPSFDAHREGTFATVHSTTPFYSMLIRVDPNGHRMEMHQICYFLAVADTLNFTCAA